jgi:capsular polysaccharide biosynthesis protein
MAWDSTDRGNLEERLAVYEDPVDLDDRAPGRSTGLVSLGFLWAALGRRVRFWSALGVLGLIIGAGYYVASPPAHQATTSVLLVEPNAQQSTADTALTEITLAESLPVATAVVKELGLPETPQAFLANYSAKSSSTQVLLITASGKTSDQAVQIAQAVAKQFLAYRAAYEQTQYNLLKTQLNQQLAAANQEVSAATTDSEKTAATNNLSTVQAYATPTLTQAKTQLQNLTKGSVVLNAAEPVNASAAKGILKYAGGGLLIGLALGIIIVAIGAITSDKLRRRDDIAYAIGAPVRLSVGQLRAGRIPALSGGSATIRRRNISRIADYLRQVIPGSNRGPASLAVVPVDDAASVAEAVVMVATSVARDKRVVVADLSAGALAARLLGVRDPGVVTVSPDGAPMVVITPAAGVVAPTGPLPVPGRSAGPDADLAAACSQADVILSLVSLDPAVGGDHLATWATDVVAMVTAGQSTATRIHTVGQMIRLTGARLASVVVMDADKADESLGAPPEDLAAAAFWP